MKNSINLFALRSRSPHITDRFSTERNGGRCAVDMTVKICHECLNRKARGQRQWEHCKA